MTGEWIKRRRFYTTALVLLASVFCARSRAAHFAGSQ